MVVIVHCSQSATSICEATPLMLLIMLIRDIVQPVKGRVHQRKRPLLVCSGIVKYQTGLMRVCQMRLEIIQ